MKMFIEVSPAETMLLEVAMTEYNEASKAAEAMKARRLDSIAVSHPESKVYNFEVVGGKLCMVYEVEETGKPEEPPVPPVKKPRKSVL